jgi:hypothetical protein
MSRVVRFEFSEYVLVVTFLQRGTRFARPLLAFLFVHLEVVPCVFMHVFTKVVEVEYLLRVWEVLFRHGAYPRRSIAQYYRLLVRAVAVAHGASRQVFAEHVGASDVADVFALFQLPLADTFFVCPPVYVVRRKNNAQLVFAPCRSVVVFLPGIHCCPVGFNVQNALSFPGERRFA